MVADAIDAFMKLTPDEMVTAVHTMVIEPEIDLMDLLAGLIEYGCPGCKEA